MYRYHVKIIEEEIENCVYIDENNA